MEPYEVEAMIEERVAALLAERKGVPVTAIQPFDAAWYRRNERVPVRVVGIRRDINTEASFQFVVINEEDGMLYCDAVDTVEGDLPYAG
jgi:hypothetical protein